MCSSVFPGHALSSAHVYGLIDHSKMLELFEALYGHFNTVLPFMFFGHPFVSPIGNTASESCEAKLLPVIIFDKCPKDKSVYTE